MQIGSSSVPVSVLVPPFARLPRICPLIVPLSLPVLLLSTMPEVRFALRCCRTPSHISDPPVLCVASAGGAAQRAQQSVDALDLRKRERERPGAAFLAPEVDEYARQELSGCGSVRRCGSKQE